MWAAAAVHAVGRVNFLDDPSHVPHCKPKILYEFFGIAENTGQNKSKEIRKVQFGDDLPGSLRDRALHQYIETHPEKDLLAFVHVESANWLQRVVPEESDKFVVMAALNLANCIAFVPLPAQTKPVRRTQRANVLAPRLGKVGRRS